MPIVHAVLGAVVLLFGRTLYWVFVGIVGFFLGLQLADALLIEQQPWVRVLVGIAAGLGGTLLALFAHRVAFAIAGFFAGGYLALRLVDALAVDSGAALWLIVGGVLGAALAALLIDWALILLSSLVGAGAIVAAFELAPPLAVVLFLLLTALGLSVQSRSLRRRRSAARPAARLR